VSSPSARGKVFNVSTEDGTVLSHPPDPSEDARGDEEAS
jgi:hypothetical protein